MIYIAKLLVLISTVLSLNTIQAQNKQSVVDTYVKQVTSDNYVRLRHGPFETNFNAQENAIVFFVSDANSDLDQNYGVLYNAEIDDFEKFGFNTIDLTYGQGVLAVFFENLDGGIDTEMIVIYESACRSFYADGGYAGIKMDYQTRVFKYEHKNKQQEITEYKVLGELLTVNGPQIMGTQFEEKLIGRNLIFSFEKALGVTNSVARVKKRIEYLRTASLLK
ncbi:MAG: hypothetical protein JEZ09_02310 [Salinivirgaceae bacterium]|nr:hypothetical protein [Salinivirgaceae bacterium]